MRKVLATSTLMFLAVIASPGVQAEGLDAKNFYLGGGLTFNSLPGVGSARGFQFFGGYEFDFKLNEDISTAVEIGYMDSGDFDHIDNNGNFGDATGLWAAMVESVPLSSKADMLVRLGYDFGDDDGLLIGAGLQYKFDTKLALRMEYVVREHIDGLQANLLFKF